MVSVHSINLLIFVTDMESVYFAVRAETLYVIEVKCRF